MAIFNTSKYCRLLHSVKNENGKWNNCDILIFVWTKL